MPNQWTITSAGGGRGATVLVGTRIILSGDGNSYQFGSMSTTTGNRLPTPPFDFPPFLWAPRGRIFTWWIHITTLTGGASGNQAQGTWRNNDPSPDPVEDESGTFTAQAGATLEEGDAAAASAGGGSSV